MQFYKIKTYIIYLTHVYMNKYICIYLFIAYIYIYIYKQFSHNARMRMVRPAHTCWTELITNKTKHYAHYLL